MSPGGGLKGSLELIRKIIRFGSATRPQPCLTNKDNKISETA